MKGLGLSAMQALVEEREANGPYRDLFDLTERVDPGALNRSAVEILVKCGALDALGPNRAQHFAVVDRAVQAAANKARDAAPPARPACSAGTTTRTTPPKSPPASRTCRTGRGPKNSPPRRRCSGSTSPATR